MFVLILFALSACASRSYIKVNYQLPDKIPDKPAITEIRLSVVDQRDNPDPLSARAREKLKNFRGNYMLIMAPKGENAPMEGIYDLRTLFERVFRKRLDQMGIRAVDSTASQIPKLEVAITRFQLDLKDYKWHFRMNYATRLVKDGNVLVKKTFSGQTERLDVPGVDDSGTTVSEMYADLINQLDIAALLSKLPPD
ncbi:MAG: hypothetical protein QNL11_12605 [Desulfobacterales bacterium]|nr:hypothetical protein [Desulfobacterales bacterium]